MNIARILMEGDVITQLEKYLMVMDLMAVVPGQEIKHKSSCSSSRLPLLPGAGGMRAGSSERGWVTNHLLNVLSLNFKALTCVCIEL